MAARSDAVPCESDESPDWPYLVCVECGGHDNDEDGDASLAPSIPRGKTTCDKDEDGDEDEEATYHGPKR